MGLTVGQAILLDTNALLRLVSDPNSVSPDALQVLESPSTNLTVSAVSAWEVAIKTRLGRLKGEPLLQSWTSILSTMRVLDLSIDSEDAILAGRLPWDHKDPFDRMIIAQASRRGLTVATSDAAIISAGLTSVLDTR